MSDGLNVRSYRPGEWFGIFGTHVSVLLPASEKPRVIGLWELVDGGADFDEVLDALIASGLRALPGFVLVSESDDPTRVVLRGPVRAELQADEGAVMIDGGGAGTWVERSLTGVTSMRVETGVEDAEGVDFAIAAGLVRVARIDRPASTETSAAASLSEAPPEPAGVPADEAEEVLGVDAPVDEAPLEEPTQSAEAEYSNGESYESTPSEAGSFAVPAAVGGAVVGGAAVGGVAAGTMIGSEEDQEQPQQEPLEQLEQPELSEQSGQWAAPDERAQQFDEAVQPAQPLDAPAETPLEGDLDAGLEGPKGGPETVPLQTFFEDDDVDEPDAVATPDPQSEQQWEDPLGSPEVQQVGEEPVIGDAVAHDAVPDQGAPQFPWGEGQGNVYAPPPAPENPFAQPAPEQAAVSAPEQSAAQPVDESAYAQPQMPAEDAAYAPPDYGQPAAPPEGDEQQPDHDGQTVSGGWDADEFQRQHPGIPGQPPAPSVTAQPVARLVFSSGDTVDVDRAVLIGRAPEARRFTSTDQPRLVSVVSPNSEVSSTHLEVRPGSGADHGSAVVTDMGSTNGTVLTLPGFGPEELQPGMAVQLIPGSLIDLGDGVTIQVTSL